MSNTNQSTCFISYSRDGLDSLLRDYIVLSLRDTLGPQSIIYDQTDNPVGGDWELFTKRLEAADAVILLLTPTYRLKCTQPGTGVFKEYNLILKRFLQSKNDEGATDTSSPKFTIIPLLCEGSRNVSIPDELQTLNYLDLSEFKIRRDSNGQFVLRNKDQKSLATIVAELTLRIKSSAALRRTAFRILRNAYYDRLFVDLKAKFDEPTGLGQGFWDTLFVKTYTYEKLLSQETQILIGRKGSGKSTLTQLLPLRHSDRYFGSCRMDANAFNLEIIFELFNNGQFVSDTNHVFNRVHAFEYTWEAVLMLSMIQELVCNNDEGEIPNSNVGNEILKELRQETKLYFENIEGIDKPFSAWEVSDLFMLAFSKTMTFVKYVIDSAPPNDETFIPQITRGFNREKYLTFCISKGLLDCLRRYLRKESRQFLISLDGFDSAFDSFRGGSGKTNSLEFLSLRSAFEIDWLRSFLRFVLQVRDRSNDFFCARLDFCVTVPKDRFLEVLQLERDSYRAWRRWRTIQWSGLELALLLRKRLEVLGEFQVTRKEQVSSSLNEALRHVHFRHLPQQIEFKHNEKEYVIPLFMYVLRHTFWRPREILLHFGSILALGEELLRSSIDVDADSIRQCIKAANPQIIESEFFSELQSVLLNIRVIVRSFSRQSNVMKGTIVCELLSKVPFTFAANPGGVVTLLDKVEFLFSVGFLGVRADTGMRTRLGLGHEDAFFFNTGMSVFGGADIRDVQEWTYVIHPIFSEYLRLDTADSELTLRFDWTYLKFQEVQMRANGLAELSDISRGIDNLE